MKDENVKEQKKGFPKVVVILIVNAIIAMLIFLVVHKRIKNTCNDTETCNEVVNSDVKSRKNDGNEIVDEKPIIYLYPTNTIDLSIKLKKSENLTCTYPKYTDEWNVTANPDGSLIDSKTGRSLYALYWEGKNTVEFATNDGFVVKGEDTSSFLEEKLRTLGLTDREAEEFIVYWLPKLEKNNYNYIRFASMEEINENMPLEFSINPDTLIRILMIYEPLDEYKEVQEQKLVTPDRTGFVAVEWGGTELNKGTIE